MSSTYRQHAQIFRKIVNHNNGGGFLICMLLDCERAGLANYVVLEHRHPAIPSCDMADRVIGPECHIRLPFCTERHRTMYVEGSGWRAQRLAEERGGQVYGSLPRGSRGMMS
jgi:hypothetical protein